LISHVDNLKTNTLSLLESSSSSTGAPAFSSTIAKHLAPADAGASGHYIADHDSVTLSNLTIDRAPVTQRTDRDIDATRLQANLPNLPASAKLAHVFPPGKLKTSLVSIPELCDANCQANYDINKLTVYSPAGIPIMSAPRSTAADGLWHFDLNNLSYLPPDHPEIPLGFDNHPRAAYASSLRTQTLAERVRFIHQVFGAPATSTFTEAASRGFLRSIPGFESANIIQRHPPHAFETAIGHLDRIRQHIQSTNKPDTNDHLALFPPVKTTPKESFVSVAIRELSHQISANESGALPAPWGKQYHLLMYSHDENYIHLELISSLSTADIIAVTQRGIEFFRAHNVTPKFKKLDNAASNPLQHYLTQSSIQFQLASPNNHRTNTAERVMRTWKCHFILTMAVADPAFPIVQSARLLAHAECTLNLMRASRIAPHISAWEQLHGLFDFTKTPLAIPGMLVAVHEVPSVLDSWGSHGIRAFYVGPAFHHYRCYQCWLPSTQETRITDTIEWFPRNVTMPGASPIEELTAATRNLISALQQISSAPESASWRQPLAQLE
jgi:hypothetical protein